MEGRGRDEGTIDKPVAAAVTRPPLTSSSCRRASSAQNLFRAVAFVCRWKMITGLSTYQLYTQRSATAPVAAAALSPRPHQSACSCLAPA